MRDWLRLLAHVARLTVGADRRTAIAVAALIVAQSGVVTGIGLSQRWLVDSATAHQVAGVVGAVLLGAAAFGVSAGAGRVRNNMQMYLNGRVQLLLNEEIQRRVADIPTVFHVEDPEQLDRLSRLRLNSRSIAAMVWSTLGALATTGGLIVTIALIAGMDARLCLLLLVALPLLWATWRADRMVREARDGCAELIRHEQRLHELCVQPSPAKELFLSGAGGLVSERATALWQQAARYELRARMGATALQGAGWLLYATGLGTSLVLLGHLVSDGQAGLGDVVLLVSLAAQLQFQLRSVLDSFSVVAEAGQVVRHYWWLRDHQRRESRAGRPAPSSLTGGIELRGVGFRYPGRDEDALTDVTLRLPAGSTVAVVGVNGAGKSTLVKLLTGVYEPTAGQILVDGQNLADLDRRGWQDRLSGVFQDFARFRLRVRETVGVGDVAYVRNHAVVEEAVTRAGARGALAPMAHGIESQIGRDFGGTEPSVGQWQRLALARSLMREVTRGGRRGPLCVVLDEPSAALDPMAEHELFQDYLDQIRGAGRAGAVTVLVSHRFTTVRLADVIVVLDGGRVTEVGSHADLLTSDGPYAELYRLQERAYLGAP